MTSVSIIINLWSFFFISVLNGWVVVFEVMGDGWLQIGIKSDKRFIWNSSSSLLVMMVGVVALGNLDRCRASKNHMTRKICSEGEHRDRS